MCLLVPTLQPTYRRTVLIVGVDQRAVMLLLPLLLPLLLLLVQPLVAVMTQLMLLVIMIQVVRSQHAGGSGGMTFLTARALLSVLAATRTCVCSRRRKRRAAWAQRRGEAGSRTVP